MSLPEKSSDEILQELFGMCLKGQAIPNNSSENESSVYSDGDIGKKYKQKKKKKKHKKERKRKRSSSAESTISRSSHKSKKMKSTEENEEPENIAMCIKIKSEKIEEVSKSNNFQEKISQTQTDSQAPNFMDVVTGQKLTIDDVFNSIGIKTENSFPLEIKKEKDAPIPVEKIINSENTISHSLESSTEVKQKEKIDSKPNEKTDSKPKKISNSLRDKKQICEVFSNNKTDNSKCMPKKIIIKNLKNSSVYEATIKEVEEKEKRKIEKYEEGEISSSSSESDNEFLNDISDKDIKHYDSASEKSHPSSKHKKGSKSDDKSERKRHSRKKKKYSKSSHESRKSSEKSKTNDRTNGRINDRNRHREKSPSKYRHERRHSRHRGRDRHYLSDSEHRDSLSRSSHHPRSRTHKLSRDRSRTKSRDRRKSGKHRSSSKSPEKIDKQKLLEIARKNAISLLKQGALPASVIVNKDKMTSIKAGGKTVDELTDFCKQLSKKEAECHSSSEDDKNSDDGKDKPFHHPFQIKERPSSIVMNIRNAVPLPTKSAQEKTLELSKQLSIQYPVSSGQQHRTTESEWVPVIREENTSSQALSKINTTSSVSYPLPKAAPTLPSVAPPCTAVVPVAATVIPPKPVPEIDIGNVVAQRLEAIRRLTENPADPIGNNLIQKVDSKMQVWAESKVQPGLFTGSTGVRTLTAAELSGGCRVWPKKNQLITAKPVQSDKGEALMKKMGWQPGEGLGKYKQGPAAPFEISLKTDRKGLAEQPQPKILMQPRTLQKSYEMIQNKHPVSILNEYCSRKKLSTPQYVFEEKEGAARRKLFLFTVIVQGVRYTPRMPSPNKKQSKVEAATACLQAMGLLP